MIPCGYIRQPIRGCQRGKHRQLVLRREGTLTAEALAPFSEKNGGSLLDHTGREERSRPVKATSLANASFPRLRSLAWQQYVMQNQEWNLVPRVLKENFCEAFHDGSPRLNKHDVSYNFLSDMARYKPASQLIFLDGSCIPVRGIRMRHLLRSR